MRGVRRSLSSTFAVVAALAVLPPPAAAASQPVDFSFNVQNLPPDLPFLAAYGDPSDVGMQGSVQASSGTIAMAVLQSRGVFLLAALPNAPLSANISQWVQVSTGTLSGVATVRAGASATLTNMNTGKQVTLTNGTFSIPTGVGTRGALPSGGTRTIRCKGGPMACTASVRIAGGASNRKLIIKLTDTNLRLLSVVAVPKSSSGAYLLTGGRFALGGSEYRVTLNAVKANPRGSHLLMRFGRLKLDRPRGR